MKKIGLITDKFHNFRYEHLWNHDSFYLPHFIFSRPHYGDVNQARGKGSAEALVGPGQKSGIFSMAEMSVAEMSIGRNVRGRNVVAEMS